MGGQSERDSKLCPICGRIFHWRKKWERDWEAVRYCSDQCKRSKLDDTDRALERHILELTTARGAKATICPSEATRLLADPADADLNQRTRSAARRLAAQGRILILQKNRPVDPSTARGPIRLRRKP